MTEYAEDYTKVDFPFEARFANGARARLYAAWSDIVVGASYYLGHDGTEYFSQTLHWQANGNYADGSYPHMNLMLLPKHVAEIVAKQEEKIANIRARLDAHPDAPTEWRERDEAEIAKAENLITELSK